MWAGTRTCQAATAAGPVDFQHVRAQRCVTAIIFARQIRLKALKVMKQTAVLPGTRRFQIIAVSTLAWPVEGAFSGPPFEWDGQGSPLSRGSRPKQQDYSAKSTQYYRLKRVLKILYEGCEISCQAKTTTLS